MDPAAADQIRQALSSQGSLVNQHSQSLQELMDALRGLTANVAQIGNQLDSLSSHLPPPEPPTPSSDQPALTPREPHVPAPERYAGDPGTCRSFPIQCSLVFEQQPATYSTDGSKIAYLMGLLKGNALAWASAV